MNKHITDMNIYIRTYIPTESDVNSDFIKKLYKSFCLSFNLPLISDGTRNITHVNALGYLDFKCVLRQDDYYVPFDHYINFMINPGPLTCMWMADENIPPFILSERDVSYLSYLYAYSALIYEKKYKMQMYKLTALKCMINLLPRWNCYLSNLDSEGLNNHNVCKIIQQVHRFLACKKTVSLVFQLL